MGTLLRLCFLSLTIMLLLSPAVCRGIRGWVALLLLSAALLQPLDYSSSCCYIGRTITAEAAARDCIVPLLKSRGECRATAFRVKKSHRTFGGIFVDGWLSQKESLSFVNFYSMYTIMFPLSCNREISHSLVLYSATRMRSSASRRLFCASRISIPERSPKRYLSWAIS